MKSWMSPWRFLFARQLVGEKRTMNHTRPLIVRQSTFPAHVLLGLPAEERSAILLLGLFLNDVNWLRKLLARAVIAIGDDPDGQANFALTILLATSLAAKIHEGWNRIHYGTLKPVVKNLQMTDELRSLQVKLISMLGKDTLVHGIRNIGWHYPNSLDFEKISGIDDGDVTVLATDAYHGDILARVSAIACVEPLLKLKPDRDFKVTLKQLWDELLDCSETYAVFVSEVLALLLLKHFSDITSVDITIPDAPTLGHDGSRFFVHPPSAQSLI
jgi:hypothetical protein